MLVDDVKEIDFEDWTDEEEVSLGGGRYVGVGNFFGLVCFESRRISFAIPDGIVIFRRILAIRFELLNVLNWKETVSWWWLRL